MLRSRYGAQSRARSAPLRVVQTRRRSNRPGTEHRGRAGALPPVCARWHHSCSLRPRPDHGRAERALRYLNRRSKRAALTLTPLDLEHRPDLATRELRSLKGPSAVIRPLTSKDVTALGSFLEGLSSRTRHFSTFEGHDVKAAQDLCDAIGKYDKVRFVLEAARGKIVGLLEMSLDMMLEIARSRRP
jgi:hypothetical protein